MGLSCFVLRFIISVRRFIVGQNEYITWGSGSGSSQCPHPVSLVESWGQIVINSEIVKSFYECCDKLCACWWKTYIKMSNEKHYVVLYGGILCTSAFGCIFVCIIVWDCRRYWIRCGGNSVWCAVMYAKTQGICEHLVIYIRTNKRFE